MSGSASRLWVLYVDGDEETRGAVSDCLTDHDDAVRVHTAGSVAAGLDRAVTTPIDCVVTTDQLPDGTGIDLLSQIHEQRPDIPVVLYPRSGSERLAADAVAAGAAGYRPRPEDGGCGPLYESVRRAVERRAAEQTPLDRMTDAFMVLDREWRITYLNDRARDVVRAAMADERREALDRLIGSRLWDLVPEAVDTVFYEHYHEAMETQSPVQFDARYEPLDAWLEVRGYPSESGLSIYFRDITDQRAHEEELRRREEILTRIYRIISQKDLSFEEKVGELLSIGREEFDTEYGSLSRIEGDEYLFEIVRGPEDSDLAAGDRVPLSWTSCERAVETEQRLVINDMARAPEELADREGNRALGLGCYIGTPVMIDGGVYGTFCFYGQDPREESFSQWQSTLVDLMGNWVSYERERERREAELTRERNRLEEFASMVSHDLRNPLNVATAHLELARDEADSEHLEDIDGALDRMSELIEDVLALARLGQQVIEAEPVDVETVARQAWGTVSTDETGLVVAEDIDSVVGDDSRLRQLFENLFRNSVEHATGEGELTVTVGALPDREGFYVADDGPGIPEDERETVFETGYSTNEAGTGFGLSIVREIAEAHGGTVTVTESESGGARFEIAGIGVR